MTTEATPGPWWTDGQYDGQEMGCAILAANTDRGPLPGNPTRGMVAFATELINTQARRCEANARLIAAAPDLLKALNLVLPLAKGYAAAHKVGSNAEYVAFAEDAIAAAVRKESEDDDVAND